MINYYYEITNGVNVFGHPHRYLAQYDVHPGLDNGGINWKFHDEAVKHSNRVWLENANGVSLVKGPNRCDLNKIDEQELVWLKLICRDIDSL
jgi:hypothetical protein